jgi:hypothetical protein
LSTLNPGRPHAVQEIASWDDVKLFDRAASTG